MRIPSYSLEKPYEKANLKHGPLSRELDIFRYKSSESIWTQTLYLLSSSISCFRYTEPESAIRFLMFFHSSIGISTNISTTRGSNGKPKASVILCTASSNGRARL